MLYTNKTQLLHIALHHVGNKQNGDAIHCSSAPLPLDDEMKELLSNYFLKSFKEEDFYRFTHSSDKDLNEVFTYISHIFADDKNLHEQSENLAKYLYEQSTHPKIKGGEFYVVYFKDCVFEGKATDAVGLFKSENKDTFLKVYPKGENFELERLEGININKLDKGCLVFNTEQEEGYVVAVVDKTNRNAEARYWIDDFLQIEQRTDAYFHTHSTLDLCKNYLTQQLPEEFEINGADRSDLLNKSIAFFKNKEEFNQEEFGEEVLQMPEVIDSFDAYKTEYENDYDIRLPNQFEISENAVKKQNRIFKSVIKLDKNFHIYVHGDRSKIEQNEDNKGKFYKIYFDKES